MAYHHSHSTLSTDHRESHDTAAVQRRTATPHLPQRGLICHPSSHSSARLTTPLHPRMLPPKRSLEAGNSTRARRSSAVGLMAPSRVRVHAAATDVDCGGVALISKHQPLLKGFAWRVTLI
jgi:hypothetical protein